MEKKRIIAIDLLRGYLLFVIIIDHLVRYPGFYDIFTGQGRLWMSAAEGFFFISGMMVGLVRGKQLIREGFKKVTLKLWKRSFLLYLLSVILTFIFASWALHIKSPQMQIYIHPEELFKWDFIKQVLMLKYRYGWSDFLPYYAVFIFFSPIALLALKYKQWLAITVISISIYIWSRGISSNFYLSWQLLFFNGIIIGFHLDKVENWFRNLSFKGILKKILFATTIITVSISFTMVHKELRNLLINLSSHFLTFMYHGNFSEVYVNVSSIVEELYTKSIVIFNKENLAPGRVLVFSLWFTTLYILFRTHENKIAKYFGWFFIPLGVNSLTVYVIHAFFIFFATILIPPKTPAFDAKLFMTNTLLNTFVLISIWYIILKLPAAKAKILQIIRPGKINNKTSRAV